MKIERVEASNACMIWENISISFTDADLQHLTNNNTAGRTALNAEYTQLCGWLGVEDLCLGAVSD